VRKKNRTDKAKDLPTKEKTKLQKGGKGQNCGQYFSGENTHAMGKRKIGNTAKAAFEAAQVGQKIHNATKN